MKVCGKCKELLNDTEFHKCRLIADGLQIQCKKCRAEYQRSYRKTNAGKERDKKWNSSDGARLTYIRYKESHPIVKAAHQAIKNEIRSGRMSRGKCVACGDPNKAQAHHDNYAFPLVVRWLCPSCHSKWHKENGEGKNA
jgi:hypothetical protein